MVERRLGKPKAEGSNPSCGFCWTTGEEALFNRPTLPVYGRALRWGWVMRQLSSILYRTADKWWPLISKVTSALLVVRYFFVLFFL